MTITTPTENSYELAYFRIEFDKENLDNVMWHIDMLVSPQCVKDCEDMDVWKII